jgi:uncharacterized membrane protein
MSRTAPAVSDLPVKQGFRLRGIEMTRLETFTDAAFAFALTLLVISLDPPTDLVGLLAALREVPAFIFSGALLMVFWWGHDQWSRRYGLDDGPTVVLSCVLVFTVLVYVIPLRLLGSMFFLWIEQLTGLPVGSPRVQIVQPGDIHTLFIVYGLGFVAMAGSILLLYVHAWRQRDALGLDAFERHETLADAGIWGIVAVTGALSVVVALVAPPDMIGLPGWVYMILPVANPVYHRWVNRRMPAPVQR